MATETSARPPVPSGSESPIRLVAARPVTSDASGDSQPPDSWSDQDTQCLEKLRAMLPVEESEVGGNYNVLVLAIEYIRQLEAMLK